MRGGIQPAARWYLLSTIRSKGSNSNKRIDTDNCTVLNRTRAGKNRTNQTHYLAITKPVNK